MWWPTRFVIKCIWQFNVDIAFVWYEKSLYLFQCVYLVKIHYAFVRTPCIYNVPIPRTSILAIPLGTSEWYAMIPYTKFYLNSNQIEFHHYTLQSHSSAVMQQPLHKLCSVNSLQIERSRGVAKLKSELILKSLLFVDSIFHLFHLKKGEQMASIFDSIEKGLDAWGFDLCQPFSSTDWSLHVTGSWGLQRKRSRYK